ncbi:MAG: M50 family metallopeptidase [Pirellulaceae bacterium]|nr:M50 family metallopeptidase [Pirellulaceae bacterium]
MSNQTVDAESHDPSLIATAFHEAGHAVAALALGRPIQRVTIVPGKTHAGVASLGQCQIQKGRFKPTKDWLEDEILILMAGMVAEYQYTGQYSTAGATQDLRAVRRFAETRATGERQVARLERRLLDKTEYLLADDGHWQAVQSIVKELLIHQTISGRAARHLFDEATRDK